MRSRKGATPIPHRPPSLSRFLPVRVLALAAGSLLTVGALGGCGSPPNSATVLGSRAHQYCIDVSDVLSDGPDPDTDSVGYAQAQILPLEQLKISEPALRTAVTNLAAAFQAYSSSTGPAQDEAAVQTAKAEHAVNAICPGAAP